MEPSSPPALPSPPSPPSPLGGQSHKPRLRFLYLFATPPGGPFRPLSSPPAMKILPCPTVPPSPPGARALLPITRARGGGEPSWTPPPLPPRPALLTPLPGGPLHPPSALALWDPMEPSRRRSDGDPSSPVGWRALRSEGWKWEGSRTDLSRSGRVEGCRVEGVEGWLSPLALPISPTPPAVLGLADPL